MLTDGLHVRFLTGSQDLYGQDTLGRVEEQARAIVAGLSTSAVIPVRIDGPLVVKSPDGIRRACLDAESDDACIGVIAWMHTFSPAKMWIAGLQSLRKPFLHLHTQSGRDLPWAEIDMDYMNLNQSAHGDREFAYIVSRLRHPRKVVVGHWQDEDVQAGVGTWARAAAGAHEARHLRIARFGDNMREVAVTEGDKVEAQARFGFAVNGYGIGELAARITDVDDVAADRLCDEYDATYEMAPGLRRGGKRRDALKEAARIELGLRAFLDEGGFGAFTDTFEDLGAVRQLPGIAAQRLMADGYGFGGEGDWKTAALVRIVKVMSDGLDGGTSFMEDYTYDFGSASPLVLGAHMLEVCPSISDVKARCEIHPLSIGGREDPVRLVFTARPGPSVVVGLSDMGDRLRLVANAIDTVESPQDLPKLPTARALWRPRPDFATAAEAWLLAGGPHHTCYSQAIGLEALEDLAEIVGVELLTIDASTEIRSFRDTLRWNRVYWHLAGAV